MRLTRKYKSIPECNISEGYDVNVSNNRPVTMSDIIYKLGKLEDIEEELGLDLATVFKALSFPIYVKEKDQTWWCSNRLFFGIGEAFIVITYWKGVENEDIICLLKDYGKTWALTKDELE